MFRVVFILIIALSGCFASNTVISKNDLNTSIAVKEQRKLVASNNIPASVITIGASRASSYQDLKLRVINVEDSRCPTGAACIWAGQLVVTLEVSSERYQTETIKLVRKREAEIANAFGLDFLLLNVEPYPKEGKVIQQSDQIITLQIVQASGNEN